VDNKSLSPFEGKALLTQGGGNSECLKERGGAEDQPICKREKAYFAIKEASSVPELEKGTV